MKKSNPWNSELAFAYGSRGLESMIAGIAWQQLPEQEAEREHIFTEQKANWM